MSPTSAQAALTADGWLRPSKNALSGHPSRTARPVTMERLASAPLIFYGAESADADPIRRQLAERAQADG